MSAKYVGLEKLRGYKLYQAVDEIATYIITYEATHVAHWQRTPTG